MNKFILGLLGLALVGGTALLAQDPPAAQAPKETPKGEPIPPPIVISDGATGACAAGCCQKTKTVCCPEHYVKEKKIVGHTFGSEKKCLPPCLGLLHCFHCDANDHARCGHSICTRYLIKKEHVCEKDAVKCNPVEVPACRHGHGCQNGSCGAGPAPVTVISTEPQATPRVTTEIPTTNK